MSRKNHGRWTLAAALAATLMAATPAQAMPLGGWADASGLFLRAWQWVAGVGQGVGVPGRTSVRPRGMRQEITKCGLHIDPNGSQGCGTSPTSSTSDSGMGADPNGG